MKAAIPRFSVALTSAAALAYEVLLMRLFSISQWYHFAYMVIGLALLGYGASGTFLTLARRFVQRNFFHVFVLNQIFFGASATVCYLLTQRLPFNPQELLWDPKQFLWLTLNYLLLAIPFFFAANVIGLALAHYRREVPQLYAADLLGAGIGSLGVLLLLFWVFPGSSIKLISIAAFLAALIAIAELGLARRLAAVPGLIAVLLLMTPGSWLRPQMSPYKALSQTLNVPGTETIAERSSPLGMITAVRSPVVPLRHAPGLSLRSPAGPPEQIGLFTDGNGMTAVNKESSRKELTYLDQLTSALPYHLRHFKEVAILGTGGGNDVLQARYHGVPRIDAVELNPQIITLVRTRLRAFSGDPYGMPGVDVHIDEARSFVAGSRKRFDLIQIALLDSFGTSSAGLHALNESYLYTMEAFSAYLDHLAEDGYLAITRWINLPPRDIPKLYATAVAALIQDSGADRPGEHLILIRGWQTGTLLIKKTPFNKEELQALRGFCEERAFDIAWAPHLRIEETNRYNILREPYFYRTAAALSGGRSEEFIKAYPFNIRPATDNQPYFFQFFKWSTLPQILSLWGRGGVSLLEWGYVVLVATLVQAAWLSLLLILLPLALAKRTRLGATAAILKWQTFAYFFALGLGFLFLEIAFMQKFILFSGNPIYAAALVLASFLFFAGAGSRWSRRLAAPSRGRVYIKWVTALIGCVALSYVAFLDEALARLIASPTAVKAAATIAFVAPLAFLMGIPFPLGLDQLGKNAPLLMPWAWGINGCASVISTALSSLLAVHFGFKVVIVLAVLLYFSAAMTFPGKRAVASPAGND